MATSQASQFIRPVSIVCVGMAGSGKTTFMQRAVKYLHNENEPPYVINLDPAVLNVPFDCNIDIRDSVNYKEVMKSYNLGPNGGILTSLNLFATKIDQVLTLLEKRTTPDPAKPGAKTIKNILVDTPGQIEVFVWSASGSILLDSLASTFPTVIAYIIDTPRTASTSTFMSNMLYACSILYKTKLPMILVFNKTDIRDADFAKEWMMDFEAFQAALKEEEETGSYGGIEGTASGLGGGSGYMGSLLNSMSLMLEEFYSHLSVVGVSAMTGEGIDDFFDAVKEKAEEFERDYKPELDRKIKEREDEKVANREKELGKLMKDMAVTGDGPSRDKKAKEAAGAQDDMDTLSDMEDDTEEEGNDGNKEYEDTNGLSSSSVILNIVSPLNIPLRPLLVQNTMSTLLATNRITSLQWNLGIAVTAEIGNGDVVGIGVGLEGLASWHRYFNDRRMTHGPLRGSCQLHRQTSSAIILPASLLLGSASHFQIPSQAVQLLVEVEDIGHQESIIVRARSTIVNCMGCCLSNPSPYPAGQPSSSSRAITSSQPQSQSALPRPSTHASNYSGRQPRQPLAAHVNSPLKVHKWTSTDRRWTRGEIDQERIEFFDTRVTGRAEIWQTLRAVLGVLWNGGDAQDQDGGLATAQQILEAAEITVPTGDMANGVYDSLGGFYPLPECILSDPTNLAVQEEVQDEDENEENTKDVEEASEEEDEEELQRRRELKGKAVVHVNDMIKVRARMSDGAARDFVNIVGKADPVRMLIATLTEEAGISSPKYIRIAYMGRLLNDNQSLLSQGWKEGNVINAMVMIKM
ncbi:hypothetical protein B7494_g8199 [Chlorociboria aeruginascens]|nr:hypothetical protein B7494_g8199 [Chlorociboria aeruginascens]